MATTLETAGAGGAGVESQLADLERQGGSMARLAHICAGALLFVFSAGSLVSLSYAALLKLIATWQAGHGVDIPNAINTGVNPLLVVAMDIAMLYAASVLRVLIAARASWKETRVHIAIMAAASLLESATYLYMQWQFDRPQNGWLWLIAAARALAAPLFAVYLSMARALPIAPRDVAYQASLHSGRGVIRDVAKLANNPGAPLHRKVRIYKASSRMTPQDAEQFTGIIEAVSEHEPRALPAPAAEEERSEQARPAVAGALALAVDPEPEPPTPGGNGPRGMSERSAGRRPAREPVIRLVDDRPRRADAGRRSEEARARWELHTDTAADMLTTEPHMSTRELARRMSAQLGAAVGVQRATEVRRAVQPTRPARGGDLAASSGRVGVPQMAAAAV